VLLAVGDVASCDGTNDDDVAWLAAHLPGAIAMLGDIAYPDGSAANFAECFDPSWAPLLPRIHPVPGNHEYLTADAAPYFARFGAAAGKPGEGWYSYDLADWHIIALNSNCEFVGGCGKGSAQLTWLEADLRAHPAACTLAYWHHAPHSSGLHEDDDPGLTADMWDALAAANADVQLAGHDHDYEQVAPIDGIRSFVVGTGGRSLYPFEHPAGSQTEDREDDAYGLLMLTLRASAYDWRFVPAIGSTLVDAGTAECY
jgi:hypothetical protein